MGWTDWFSGSRPDDGASDKASFKSSSSGDEHRQERISRTSDSGSKHEHTWSKTGHGTHQEGWKGGNSKK